MIPRRLTSSLAGKLVVPIVLIGIAAVGVLTWLAVTSAGNAQRDAVQRGLRDQTQGQAQTVETRSTRSAAIAHTLAVQMSLLPGGDRAMATQQLRGVLQDNTWINGVYYTFDVNGFGTDAA